MRNISSLFIRYRGYALFPLSYGPSQFCQHGLKKSVLQMNGYSNTNMQICLLLTINRAILILRELGYSGAKGLLEIVPGVTLVLLHSDDYTLH
ncbi:hypothetical protein RDI58_026773 [Solanum bulbocastanum]|uniref:Uncharacterized protein n=1 Tax=Solanum bulbocastanum TaxID=147425 RepID=A0AAN8SZP3_SOLBU